MQLDSRLGARSASTRTSAARRASPVVAYLPVAAAAAVLAAVPLVAGGSRYFMSLAVMLLVFAAYGTAFNVIFGSTGQLFLCLGALAGLAAYASAILGNDLGVPLWLGVPLGVALSSALGGLFSWVSVRRRLDVIFVGIVTLAFSLVFHNVVLGQRRVTGGETGLVVEAGAGTLLRGPLSAYYAFVAVLVGYLALYRLIQRSRLGWAFRALRDDEVAAELTGIDVARCKVIAGALGSAMLGLVGALYAHYEGFVSPTTYAFAHVDVRVLVILAFGGIGSLLGPIAGATAVTVIDEVLRPLGQLRVAVYGITLIVLFLAVRRGVVPAVTGLARPVTDLARRATTRRRV